MSSWNEKPVTVPSINVNLETCNHAAKGHPFHEPYCSSRPVPIPCSIRRTVEFTVRLGECWGVGPGRCVSEDSAQRFRWTNRHSERCPARPVRVTCTISGKTWAESEVTDAEVSTHPLRRTAREATPEELTACRERWALVKALVLGLTMEVVHGRALASEQRDLFVQRDAVYTALADMAKAEETACNAQQRVDEAFPSDRYVKPGDTDHRAKRPSVNRLARYVEHLIEQVEVMP